ncbi:MAG TPA: hypothetical protein PLB21_09370 [Actinomycetota bacterium]|jgi:hypothetical protein|nr:hypothetical protein [Actinomycetota bacterium]
MKKRFIAIFAATLTAAALGAAPAQAVCGRMDMLGPGSDPYVDFYYDSSRVRVIPHGNGAGVRAVKARYYASTVRYYYGGYVWNPLLSGSSSSRVTATVGTNVGSYYHLSGSSRASLYPQYNYCAINSY